MNRTWQRFKASYLLFSFKQDKTAIFSLAVLLVLLATGLLAPVVSPYDPYDPANVDIMNSELPPSWTQDGEAAFLLGTDIQGRDLLSTMIYGLRLSILIGFGAAVLQGFLGVVVGLLAGYLGGKIDAVLMRIADIQLSFPYLMVAIFISAIFQLAFGIGRYEDLAVPLLIVIIGLAEWPVYARTVRASVMGEKNKEYVEAARVIGLNRWRIMFRHVLPNTMTSVLVISTIQVANAIMSEAALSFLGLGMPVTKPSLGSLIRSGFEYIFSGSWWITLFPGIFLVLLVLVINLLGDWLRDVLNPKLYKG
ncbi:ABC transporter permease [Desulfosarcina sp.]|uniref:ABC transporter permease n=1 Tax=Desulfosarcina sp. TaxID=2027861 RepID=UPI0029A347BE|nr:ABC transporter permease [Desulfosarcina sp.]MDX2453364.1 ABC transporter permease [Desulfosarcina sp.]MDX2491085.1 ABC transporter permease [Desulfosarcina sp.]